MKRNFNFRQRSILAWVAGGRCMKCGTSLGKDFHADHVLAFSKGGATVTSNGQALCKTCNLKKGNK